MTTKHSPNSNIGIIGLGRMGRCLVRGFLESELYTHEEIFFTTRHSETAEHVSQELGIESCQNNAELVEKCGTIVIAVKPQNMTDVLEELKKVPLKEKMFVSIVASI